MMEEYKIQIIVPVHNGEQTIRRCLDSLKNQTFAHWQAILVDDASTDGSVEIIRQYVAEDDRFVLIELKNNGGVSYARNTALDKLDAEYVAFLDCDDFWEENMLEVMYSGAQKYSCEVVQCRFVYDFKNGKQVLPAGAFKKETFLTGSGLKKVYVRMMTGIKYESCMYQADKNKAYRRPSI